MSRFWGYSKRPKNWKKILEEIQSDDADDNPPKRPAAGQPSAEKPIAGKSSSREPKPGPKPAIKQDSSISHV